MRNTNLEPNNVASDSDGESEEEGSRNARYLASSLKKLVTQSIGKICITTVGQKKKKHMMLKIHTEMMEQDL